MTKIFSFILQLPPKNRAKLLFPGLLFGVSLIVSIFLCCAVIDDLISQPAPEYSMSGSINDLKKTLGVQPGLLKRELGISLSTSNRLALDEIGVAPERLDAGIKTVLFRSHTQNLKLSLFFTLAFLGLFVLTYVSERNQSQEDKNKLLSRQIRTVYIFTLLFSVLVGGFLLGKSPNPMEAAVKGLKTISGFYASGLAILFLFSAASLIGNKIICGWACPFGALQELLFIFSKPIKKYRLPFWVTSSIRIIVLIIALMILFGLIGRYVGTIGYHYINPFNIFIPDFKLHSALIAIVIFLAASLFFYRPFCQFICPFGLISWILEKFSIVKIRVDQNKCIKCKKCYKACPTGSIEAKVTEGKIPKECFSCGRCLSECPTKAISYDPF